MTRPMCSMCGSCWTFARVSIERGHFKPAEIDLLVPVQDGTTVLRFCHESDIHLDSSNVMLIEEMMQRWKNLGFEGFQKIEGQWVAFGVAN